MKNKIIIIIISFISFIIFYIDNAFSTTIDNGHYKAWASVINIETKSVGCASISIDINNQKSKKCYFFINMCDVYNGYPVFKLQLIPLDKKNEKTVEIYYSTDGHTWAYALGLNNYCIAPAEGLINFIERLKKENFIIFKLITDSTQHTFTFSLEGFTKIYNHSYNTIYELHDL